MTNDRCNYAAALWLLGVVWVARSSAGFTESFQPSDEADSKAMMSGLWQQYGTISTGDGRGAGTNKAAMKLTGDHPAAETVLLTWDGTQSTLDFWYYLNEACDKGSLKVSMSCDSKDWFPVMLMKTADMQPNAYNIARVRLPLNATCRAFAVRWDFKISNCYSYIAIWLDDITFPAQAPGTASSPPPTGKTSQDPSASEASQSPNQNDRLTDAGKVAPVPLQAPPAPLYLGLHSQDLVISL